MLVYTFFNSLISWSSFFSLTETLYADSSNSFNFSLCSLTSPISAKCLYYFWNSYLYAVQPCMDWNSWLPSYVCSSWNPSQVFCPCFHYACGFGHSLLCWPPLAFCVGTGSGTLSSCRSAGAPEYHTTSAWNIASGQGLARYVTYAFQSLWMECTCLVLYPLMVAVEL